MSYFNTTRLTGASLLAAIENTDHQEALIMSLFLLRQSGKIAPSALSPSYIHRLAFSPSVPLTSVRRAVTSLTDSGHLIKTDVMFNGRFGKPEHCWKLAEKHR